MLKWNGDWLTDGIIVKEWIMEARRFCVIETTGSAGATGDSFMFPAELNKLDDSLVVIIDELAPLFGLHKRGSHRIKIKDKPYVLYQVMIANNNIVLETKLSSISIKDALRKQYRDDIQKLVIFQNIINLNRIGDSHIIVRTSGDISSVGAVKFLGCYQDKIDLNPKASHNHINISKTYHSKHFDEDKSVHDIIRIMINKDDIYDLRDDIEKIILRINKNYLWYANFLINRLLYSF